MGLGCGVGWGPGFGPEVVGYVGSGCGLGLSIGVTFLGIGIGLPASGLTCIPCDCKLLSNLSWTGLSVCLSSFVQSPFFDELGVVNVPGAKVLGF
jgi:hypothetical protein